MARERPAAATGVDRNPVEPFADLQKVEALLRQHVTGQKRIIELLERQQQRPTHFTRHDRERLARILPAIAGVYGSAEFTSRDLAEDASPAVRLVVRGLSVKSIGRLLARADGVAIDGYAVERCGVDINVMLWRIVAVCSTGDRLNGLVHACENSGCPFQVDTRNV